MNDLCIAQTLKTSKFTIKDIAAIAGVSTATVSNAFSGKGNISDSKKEEIIQIADKFGYVPNATARALYKGTVRIAVLMPANPEVLAVRFKTGFENAMKKQNCASMECTIFSYRTVNNHFKIEVEELIAGNYDGIIVTYPNIYEKKNAELLEKINALNVPIVTFSGKLEILHSCSHIGIDAECGGRMAGDLLGNILKKGDKIAVFTADKSTPEIHQAYINGFESELEYYGLSVSQIYRSGETITCAYKNAIECFSQKEFPKGIFVTPYSAWIVADAAREVGILDKVKIIGMDTVENNVALLKNGSIFALIDQRQALQAERAMSEVVRKIFCDETKSETTVTPHIVTRGKYE